MLPPLSEKTICIVEEIIDAEVRFFTANEIEVCILLLLWEELVSSLVHNLRF